MGIVGWGRRSHTQPCRWKFCVACFFFCKPVLAYLLACFGDFVDRVLDFHT